MPQMILMYEYNTSLLEIRNQNYRCYPCSAKKMGFQKSDKAVVWAFSIEIFIVSAVTCTFDSILQKWNKAS